MSAAKLVEIRTEIFKAAAYYREKIDDVVLAMYAEDLSDFTVDEVRFGYLKLRRDPKTRRLPLPAQVREAIQPELDPMEEAKEMAGTIMRAISRCGSYAGRSAREMIGEVGWEVVMRMGGWNSLCSSITHENETSYMAQMRELCLVGVKRSGGFKTKTQWKELEQLFPPMPELPEAMSDLNFSEEKQKQLRHLERDAI